MGVYKEITDEFYELYKDFIDSGFSEEQAIAMISIYCQYYNPNNSYSRKMSYKDYYSKLDSLKERK